MNTKCPDWFDSVFVRVYPRADATPDDLKLLGASVRQWLKVEVRRAGFRRARFDKAQLAALEDGELPLPEALWLANQFRRRRRIADPAIGELAKALRRASPADWLRIRPESTRRTLSFDVFGVGYRMRSLFDSLCTALHAPAIARLEFAWLAMVGFDQIGERRHEWVLSDA